MSQLTRNRLKRTEKLIFRKREGIKTVSLIARLISKTREILTLKINGKKLFKQFAIFIIEQYSYFYPE